MKSGYDFYNSRRIIERKRYNNEVIFSRGSLIFRGKCNNISGKGACISSRNIFKIEAGNEILIAIPYAKKQGSIKKKAIVKWTNNDQFGIQFFRRKKIRKRYQNVITVFISSNIFSANLKDISMGGAHVISKNIQTVKEGSQIYVTIPYAKKIGHLTRKAVVKWIDNDQFGFQFI